MKLPLLALVVAGLLFTGLRGDSPNEVVGYLPSTPEHQRNSEGAFVTLRSGRIEFYYSQFYGGFSDYSSAAIAEIHSDDQGRTWSAPRAFAEKTGGVNLMSVSVLRLASGKLAMFYVVKKSGIDCRPYLRISSDEAVTWSEPKLVVPPPGYYVLNNDRVIQTSRGRLVMPLAFNRSLVAQADGPGSAHGRLNDYRGIILWYLSDDEGATWREAATWWTLPVPSVNGLQEPGVVELADGSLCSWARTDVGTQYQFYSHDGGENWSPPEPGDLVSTLGPASIKRLPHSDTLLAIFNDRTGLPIVRDGGLSHRFVRTPLTAALSTDGGRSWPFRKSLEDDPNGEFCYTTIHFIDGAVLLAYSAGDPNVAHLGALRIRRVALSWLPPTAPAPPAHRPPEPYASTEPDNTRYYNQPELLGPCENRVGASQVRPCRMIFIGDSITAGWLTRASWLWTTQYSERGALNFGIGGDKTQNVLWRLDTMNLSGLRPKVAVILIGTNNLSNTPGEIAAGVEAVVDKTKQTFPGIQVILVSIMPNRRANEKMMAANSILRKYADGRTVHYLDLVPLMPPVGDNWTGLLPDHLHPDLAGYRIWADAMEPMLDRLLGEN